MADLNQFAISKILGSKIKPVGAVGFGSFSALSTTEVIQKALCDNDPVAKSPSYTYEQDAVVVQAFEMVRKGASTDELLWNKLLAKSFADKCRSLGLNATNSYLTHRLINVRKNSPRYRKHGIVIGPTTKAVIHPSIVPEYAHVIEFALVRLRYRYGSSIDDILIDECLGDKFEEMAHRIAPSLSSRNLRLGALYIRKNRVIKKRDRAMLSGLELADIEREWQGVIALSSLRPQDVPAAPGLIEFKENGRYLYISHNKNIHLAARQLGTGDAFRFVGSSFWKPDLDAITFSFATGKKFAGVAIENWERKLVHDRNPVFNWPIPPDAA